MDVIEDMVYVDVEDSILGNGYNFSIVYDHVARELRVGGDYLCE